MIAGAKVTVSSRKAEACEQVAAEITAATGTTAYPLALHVGAKGGDTPPPVGTASFAVNATTSLGQNIFVVGDHPSLGSWNPAAAIALSSATYPTWKGSVSLPTGTAFQYKYLRKDSGGAVTWESGSNLLSAMPDQDAFGVATSIARMFATASRA